MTSRWTGQRSPKRLVDLAIAAPALVVLAPLIAVVAVAVRLRLGPGVLFQQERAGRGGDPIIVPKFRSMTNECDARGELLPDEARLTTFGAKLRATSLDELPQLWSVIRGDMSLVGPRPLPVVYVGRYSAEQRRRLEALPGITGWAQVNGRNTSSWPERLEHDVWYVDNATFWLDLKILARTLKLAIRREGVSAAGHVTMHEFRGET